MSGCFFFFPLSLVFGGAAFFQLSSLLVEGKDPDAAETAPDAACQSGVHADAYRTKSSHCVRSNTRHALPSKIASDIGTPYNIMHRTRSLQCPPEE
jgi:hypothetical protein